MTKSRKIDFSKINIDEVLKQRRQIAIIWSIEDVHGVRPDLSDDQAWEVLIECERSHNCEAGLTWDSIEFVADELFPQNDQKGA